MKNTGIVIKIRLLIFWVSILTLAPTTNLVAQNDLSAGRISVTYKAFRRSAGTKDTGRNYHLLRTKVDNRSSWSCVVGSYDYGVNYNLPRNSVGEIELSTAKKTFRLEIYVANATKKKANEGCANGAKDGTHIRTMDANIAISSLDFNNYGYYTTTYNLSNNYFLEYTFRLVPYNQLNFSLSQTASQDPATYSAIPANGAICLDELFSVATNINSVNGVSGIDIDNIEYQFNYDDAFEYAANPSHLTEEIPETSIYYDLITSDGGDPQALATQYLKQKYVPGTYHDITLIDVFYDEFKELGGSSVFLIFSPHNVKTPVFSPLITANYGSNYTGSGINLANKIPNVWKKITQNGKDIRFRYRMQLSSGQYTSWKETSDYRLYPGIPDFKETPTRVIAACNGQENGIITFETKGNFNGLSLQNLDNIGNLSVTLFDKNKNENIGDVLNDVVFSGNTMTLKNIGAGEYIAELSFAGNNNLCVSEMTFTMGEMAPVTLQELVPKDATCYNGKGSAIAKLNIPGNVDPVFTFNGESVAFNRLANEGSVRVYQLTDLVQTSSSPLKIAVEIARSGASSCKYEITRTISIGAPDEMSANEPVISPAVCNNNYKATVHVNNLAGGSGTYVVQALNGNNAKVASVEVSGSDATLDLSAAGKYTIQVKDKIDPDCSGPEFKINLLPVDPVSLTNISVVDNICPEAAGGRISGSMNGTNEGIVILRDQDGSEIKRTTNQSWFFDELTAGDYFLDLQRSQTCTDVVRVPVKVGQPKPFVISFTETPISCEFADDGILLANVENFGMPYTYRWYKDDQPIGSNALQIEQLSPGLYTLEITPQTTGISVCAPHNYPYEIKEPVTVTADLYTDEVICLDPLKSDMILSNISGGNGRFDIEIRRDGEIYATESGYESDYYQLTQLPHGDYAVSILDADRPTCKGFSTTFSYKEVQPLSVSPEITAHNTCFEGTSGAMTIHWEGYSAYLEIRASDGDVLLETHLEDNIPFEITDLPADEYLIILYRSQGCDEREEKTVIITEPTELTFDYVKTDVYCYGQSTGKIKGTLLGATPGYRWRWLKDGVEMDVSGTSAQLTLENLPQGKYTLMAEDQANCPYQFEVSIVPLAQPMDLNVEYGDISCIGTGDGWIRVTATGGRTPYRYTWTGPGNVALPDVTAEINAPIAGDYYLRVTDDLGCQVLDTTFIYEPPVAKFPDKVILCKDEAYKVAVDFPEEEATYHWTSANGFSSDSKAVIVDKPGTYEASVTQPGGCKQSGSFEVVVSDIEFTAIFLGASWAEVGDTVFLKEISTPRPDSVAWEFSDGLTIAYDFLGDPYFIAGSEGTFEVGLYGYKGDCQSYTWQEFTIMPKGEAPELLDETVFGPQGIDEIIIYPNPSDGNFNVEVTLHQEETLSVFLYDINGEEKWRSKVEGKDKYDFDMVNSSLALQHGQYILLFVSKSSKVSRKIIIE